MLSFIRSFGKQGALVPPTPSRVPPTAHKSSLLASASVLRTKLERMSSHLFGMRGANLCQLRVFLKAFPQSTDSSINGDITEARLGCILGNGGGIRWFPAHQTEQRLFSDDVGEVVVVTPFSLVIVTYPYCGYRCACWHLRARTGSTSVTCPSSSHMLRWKPS